MIQLFNTIVTFMSNNFLDAWCFIDIRGFIRSFFRVFDLAARFDNFNLIEVAHAKSPTYDQLLQSNKQLRALLAEKIKERDELENIVVKYETSQRRFKEDMSRYYRYFQVRVPGGEPLVGPSILSWVAVISFVAVVIYNI